MAEMSSIERLFWFDQQIRDNRWPNASTMARRFEISAKTAQRTIEFLRDRIGAPLIYQPQQRGYCYEDSSFSLPQVPVTQNELLAILLARNLLAESAGGLIGESIAAFGRKLLGQVQVAGIDEHLLQQSFSACWNGYAHSEGATFELVAGALLRHQTIEFQFSSPASPATTHRRVNPYHLRHYNGNWLLQGWCHLRSGWRLFNLAGVADVQLTGDVFSPVPSSDWPQLDAAYGVFQGEKQQEVVLRFTAQRARWISREHWHPAQRMEPQADGRLLLRLPVADYREIKLKILQYGSEVEVLAPDDLRGQIRNEIEKMRLRYMAQ